MKFLLVRVWFGEGKVVRGGVYIKGRDGWGSFFDFLKSSGAYLGRWINDGLNWTKVKLERVKVQQKINKFTHLCHCEY